MISFTRKTDYALVALAALARTGVDRQQPLSARQVAEDHDLPAALIGQLLKTLHRAGLVDSERGAQGGYFLARPAQTISVFDVVQAIEGDVQLTPCCVPDEQDPCDACGAVGHCSVSGRIRELNRRLVDLLAGVSLAEIAGAEDEGQREDQGEASGRLSSGEVTIDGRRVDREPPLQEAEDDGLAVVGGPEAHSD